MEMLDYVKVTPAKLKENIADKNSLVSPLVNLFFKQKNGSVTIIASGSSFNAVMMSKPYLKMRLARSVEVVTPELFELTRTSKNMKNFTLFVSQSGASTNILHAMKYVNERNGRTIALTGNIHSEVAQKADIVIDYGVGKETVGYVTVGLSTLVMYLVLFANEVAQREQRPIDSDDDLLQLPEIMTETINTALEFVNDHFMELAQMGPTFICGNNMNLGVAREAALKFQETLKIPTLHYEIEEFMHGPDIQLNPQYSIFLIDNPQASPRIAAINTSLAVVTARHYLITYNSDKVQPNVINIKLPAINSLCSLATIPFFQIIVASMMPALNREDAHPLATKFMNMIPTKNYDNQGR